jgi:hypothetical protein
MHDLERVAVGLLSLPTTLCSIEQNKNKGQGENTSWSPERRNCCFSVCVPSPAEDFKKAEHRPEDARLSVPAGR